MKQVPVLVVEPDTSRRAQYANWLIKEGFDVMACPGPSAPDYVCMGGRGESCPLVRAADVVVLDMHLDSDEALQGTPAWELLAYYVDHRDRVVVLSGDDDSVRPIPDDDVVVLHRTPHRRSLIKAVRTLSGTHGENADGDDPAR